MAANYMETENYAEAILYPEFAARQDVNLRAPVWAENLSDLTESLEYFGATGNGKSTGYIHRVDGLVYGVLLDVEASERTYMDQEVVIARVGGTLDVQKKRSRDQKANEPAVLAFLNTMQARHPVVLIVGEECAEAPVVLIDPYAVMDYFLVTHVWAEKDRRGSVFYQARYQRLDFARAWWTPNSPEPPVVRDWNACMPPVESTCSSCNVYSPRIYDEAWLCTNRSCVSFWRQPDGEAPPDFLSFNRNWLKGRVPPPEHLRPALDLVPDVISQLAPLKATGQMGRDLRALWRGMVCEQCRKCCPRVAWELWHCDNCLIDYPLNPGPIGLGSVVSRINVNYPGHPPVAPDWPRDDFDHYGPFFREHYRMDRWILHGGSSITLISPCASFNANGAVDGLFDAMLAAANTGDLNLQRHTLKVIPNILRSTWFYNNYGEEYAFAEDPTTDLLEMPACVKSAAHLVNGVGQFELNNLYEGPNQVTVNGYMSEMSMDWHTDGQDEVGPTISTLCVGGDATMLFRLQNKYYNNQFDLFGDDDPIRGAIDWKNLTTLRHRWLAGEIPQEEFRVNPDTMNKARKLHKARPLITLPLIHGSIVIMQGTEISKYYEHCIINKDSLRFTVTCRSIDPAQHQALKARSRTAWHPRQSGQMLSYKIERGHDAFDDHDNDDDDDENDEDVAPRPAPKRRGRPPLAPKGTPRGSRRASPAAGAGAGAEGGRRSASPRGTRTGTRTHATREWTAAEDAALTSKVDFYGRKWTAIAAETAGRSLHACRQRWIQVLAPDAFRPERVPRTNATPAKGGRKGARRSRASSPSKK